LSGSEYGKLPRAKREFFKGMTAAEAFAEAGN